VRGEHRKKEKDKVMAYTSKNFKTKKELKAAVAARLNWLAWLEQGGNPEQAPHKWFASESKPLVAPEKSFKARPVTCYQPNGDITGASVPRDGTVFLEGPHYPEPHRWYAQGTMRDEELVAVK
jgi:hypothetical protein